MLPRVAVPYKCLNSWEQRFLKSVYKKLFTNTIDDYLGNSDGILYIENIFINNINRCGFMKKIISLLLADIMIIRQHLPKQARCLRMQTLTINIKDATAIQKFVAKIETGFPIGEPIASE